MDVVIVAIVLAGAGLLLARQVFRRLKGTSSGCGGRYAGCGMSSQGCAKEKPNKGA